MKTRLLPDAQLHALARQHGTPLWLLDADIVRQRLAQLQGLAVFDRVRYAQKANPSLALLRVLRAAGAEVDAVSAGECARALAAGFDPRAVLFCADLFDDAALAMLREHPFQLNLGSPHMLEEAAELRPGGALWLRVNPGFGHGHGPKVSTGGESSKHGIWLAELQAVVARAHTLGLRVEGVHMHIGSGADLTHLARIGAALEAAALACGPALRFASAGGGLPIPYREGEPAFDLQGFGQVWREARARLEQRLGRRIELEVEPGRFLVAEAGSLLCRVRGLKQTGRLRYALVDAGFHNLVRPAMYGAWHHISLVGGDARPRVPQVLAGPLCESADVLTQAEGIPQPRDLPELRAGDLVCIHDTGAYGSAMSSNYNSQPFAAEVLVEGGEARLTRRRQAVEGLWRDEV